VTQWSKPTVWKCICSQTQFVNSILILLKKCRLLALECREPNVSVVNGESTGSAVSKGLSRRVVKREKIEKRKRLGQFTNLITVRSSQAPKQIFRLYSRDQKVYRENHLAGGILT